MSLLIASSGSDPFDKYFRDGAYLLIPRQDTFYTYFRHGVYLLIPGYDPFGKYFRDGMYLITPVHDPLDKLISVTGCIYELPSKAHLNLFP